ncbi:MAG: DUF3090 family protein [bacterium]|nr:DUF3090 family protein [bacterium]
MAQVEIDLNPVDFITIGTIGPKGKRVFYLQAGYRNQLVSMVIEKEQSWALSEAIRELIDDLETRYETSTEVDLAKVDMELREPIEPIFRVSQMGLGYDEDQDKIVLVAQELLVTASEEEPGLDADPMEVNPGVVRLWCSRDQMRALSMHAMETVRAGRADPKQNGRLVYYWT